MGASMRYQPQGLIRLNRSNPITRGLVAAYVPRSGPRDATGTLATIVDVTPVVSSLGYITPPLNTGGYPVVGTFPTAPTESFSAFVLGNFTVSSDVNIAPVVSVGQPTQAAFGWKFGPAGTGGKLGFTIFNVADYVTTAAFPSSGSIAFSAKPGSNARFFASGTFQQQLTIGALRGTTSASQFSIGKRGDSGTDSTTGSQVALALYWNRALTDAEQASIAANPWQIFDAGSSSSDYQAAIATASVTAPVGSGTASLTGNQATGTAGALGASGAASVAISGDQATGTAGQVSAAAGALASTPGDPATASTGAINPSAGATAVLGGNQATSGDGNATGSGGAGASISGAQSVAGVGTVTAQAGGGATAAMTGIQANATTGSTTASGAASAATAGDQAGASVGTITAVAGGGAVAAMPGDVAVSGVGSVAAAGGASVSMTAAQATAQAGSIAASGKSNDGAAQTVGITASASVGTMTATGARSGITTTITEDMICAAVRSYILSIAPALRVIRTPVNRAAPPNGPYVSFTPGLRHPMSTTVSSTDSNSRTVKRAEQMQFQIDCYGDGARDLAETLSALCRDQYAIEQFALSGLDIAPLYSGDVMQMPFVDDADQYEDRYSFEIFLQINSIIITPQQSCNMLGINILSVDATFPPR